ncbi:hypothetical protein SDC9_171328 [bioreactor metagenome]|uniref:Uncharacterized protein n=1 Tax=bioreactor metagenome TaxID=1076179 RepID=A0A645GBC4_9ZZZZ
MHHRDAFLQRVEWVFDFDGFAVIDDLAFVHLIHAEEAFHQRGLSRAVFTHQRVNGTGS